MSTVVKEGGLNPSIHYSPSEDPGRSLNEVTEHLKTQRTAVLVQSEALETSTLTF